MSGTLSTTVAASPTTVQAATEQLSVMAALSGIPTDYNIGSQVRTLTEAEGSVIDMQGVANAALALQALAYGAMSLFGIVSGQATPATGIVTFATAFPVSAAPVVPQAVPIPSGTYVQTAGGIQFTTIVTSLLASGTSSVAIGVQAVTPGVAGNVAASAITGAPLTSVGWPLLVSNLTPTQGGTNAGTQSQALAQFAAKAASLGLSSPIAIANAAIGVVATGTGETVEFAACYEPWLAAGSGAGSGTAGFTVYIDNGTGGASASLIAAVQAWLNGSVNLNESGYRPAGVPYIVSAVTPVGASASVSGTLFPGLLSSGTVSGAVISNIESYFNTIGISPALASQGSVAGRAADAGAGAFETLTVNLYYSGSATPVPVVSGAFGTRVILVSLSVNIGVGT